MAPGDRFRLAAQRGDKHRRPPFRVSFSDLAVMPVLVAFYNPRGWVFYKYPVIPGVHA
jgi:hypothetical protein